MSTFIDSQAERLCAAVNKYAQKAGFLDKGNSIEIEIREVFRTVLKNEKPVDGQDAVPIGVDRVKFEPVDSPAAFTGSGVEPFAWNFEHTFETNIFPALGRIKN